MNDYSQPAFYRFNEDSLKLVKWILSQRSNAKSILDLGAGSGIIGIELAKVLGPENLTFVEVQDEYLPHLQKNCEVFLSREVACEIEINSFGLWNPGRQYDLIVSNPPYYLPGHGERNQDPRKELARSFILDNWRILLEKVHESLGPEGEGYLVLKNDRRIIQEIHKTNVQLNIEVVDEGHLNFVKLSRLDKN